MVPTRFRFILQSGFRGEDLKKNGQSETKQELPEAAMFLMDWDEMSNLYEGPSINAFHLAEGFQRRGLKCEKLTDDGRQTTDGK
jgi:hypothetical protein